MSEVRKGTYRNTENGNKRCKIFNKVLNMNWDYVSVATMSWSDIPGMLIEDFISEGFVVNIICYSAIRQANDPLNANIDYIDKPRKQTTGATINITKRNVDKISGEQNGNTSTKI
jgi:hypothetical protein